jgi:signal transduction histidine kinase
MENAQYTLDITEFDINELIRLCIIQLGQRIDDKNLELEVDFASDVQNVLADKDSIRRVLINLLDNAIKFSFDNTKVTIRVWVESKKVNVSIGNFGIGIEKENLRYVFDRFYKTDKSRTSDKKGAGLGLSLVKNIISYHKQNIWVESLNVKDSPNTKYTTFTFTLEIA